VTIVEWRLPGGRVVEWVVFARLEAGFIDFELHHAKDGRRQWRIWLQRETKLTKVGGRRGDLHQGSEGNEGGRRGELC
jgi:hypothetical protein